MKRIFFLLCVCLTFLIQGCAMRGPIKESYSLQGKKIAIVSELGNNFHHNIVGTTIFTNNITMANVEDWKINQLAAKHVLAHLNKQNIQATEIESDFFTSMDGSSPYTISKVSDMVIKKVKPLGFNSLLLIAPASSDNYPFYSPGYGLTTRYFFGKPSTCIYTMFIVKLHDLDTNKSIGWEWANALRGPCTPKSSNDLELKDNFDEYSDEEKIEIRRRTEARVIESLGIALDSMKLFH